MKLIYIAGPFSGASPEDIELNIASARQCGKLLARKGWMPVIPHANTAGFDTMCPGITYEFWIAGTMELLKRCDAIFMAPGWESSKGARGEREAALDHPMPVFYETSQVPDFTEVDRMAKRHGVGALVHGRETLRPGVVLDWPEYREGFERVQWEDGSQEWCMTEDLEARP